MRFIDSWPEILRERAGKLILFGALIAIPLILEFFDLVYYTDIMTRIFVFGLFALSFDLLLGYTGLLNFGHTAFFGLGAFFTAYVLSPIGWLESNFAVAIIIAMFVCIGLALALAILVRRTFRGIPFTFISLAFGMIVYMFWKNTLPPNWSGGDTGFANFELPTFISNSMTSGFFEVAIFIVIAGLICLAIYLKAKNSDIASKGKKGILIGGSILSFFFFFVAYGHLAEIFSVLPQIWTRHLVEVWSLSAGASIINTTNTYYFILVILVLTYFLTKRFVHSPVGRVWQGIRENEERIEVIGYNLFKYKTLALMTSAAIAGLSGGLFTLILPTVPYDTVFNPLISIEAIIYVVLGGLGTLVGGPVGAGFTILLKNLLDSLIPLEASSQIALIIVGIVFILAVFLLPRGIVGTWKQGRKGKPIKEIIKEFFSKIR